MAKYETILKGSFDALLDRLHHEIMESASSMELVEQSDYQTNEISIAIRVYDKYFMRNGNRTCLSITIVGHGEELFLSAIGAGGGEGIIFNSWGADEDMVKLVQSIIEGLS